MKTIAIIGAALLVVAGLLVWRIEAVSARILAARYPAPAVALAVPPEQSSAKDGGRLAHLDGCFGCHGKALRGGIMYSDIFGSRLVAPNLTRIVRRLSDTDIATAIRNGVKPDRTSLFGMPSAKLAASSDSDIAAIVAYLRTLPAKPDAEGGTTWRFGARAMVAVGLFLPEAELARKAVPGPRTTPTEPMALGRYIAQSQCSICHGRYLSGDPDEHSPDLRVVVPKYSPDKFQRFFVTGEGRKGHDTRIMAEIVRNRLHYLTPVEVGALYTYLSKSTFDEQGSQDK